MPTRKLYYENAHESTFSATVLTCEVAKTGYAVTLDATCFYPEGGGQAGDTGVLGTARVLDTQEQGDLVVHLCDSPLEVGATVTGTIDYAPRFARMQQHSGEHIVSGIICRRYGWHNVGFHMASACMTIDFDGLVPQEDLADIEREANEAIWQNLEVKCWVPDPEILKTIPYRTKKQLSWPVRIVEIPGYDLCACCGTHVSRTGEIGLIKILSVCGLRGGTRMELACGKQALEVLTTAYDQNRQVGAAFSAQYFETGEAARRMNDQVEALKFRAGQLEKRIFSFLAENYGNCVTPIHFEENLEAGAVRELCDAISRRCTGTAAVFSGTDETGYAYCLINPQADLRPLNKAMTTALQGRGGGKPNFQQGRVQAAKGEILAFWRENS